MANKTRSNSQTGNHYRISIMGPAAVGKSAIVNRFLYGKFQPDYKKTVEDMHHGEFNLDGTKLTLELLDTAGAYTFPGMRRLAITTSDAFVLVYSQDNPDSFRQVTELRDVILSQREDTKEVPIVIVANKADCTAKKNVETESAIASVDWNNRFVSASAKKGFNIAAIFAEILRMLSKEDTHIGEALIKRWSSMSSIQLKDNKSRWSFRPKRRSLFGRPQKNA